MMLWRQPLALLAASGFSAVVGFVLWFELGYLWFGVTGGDVPPGVNIVAGVVAFGLPLLLSLWRASRPAEVIVRACTVGLAVVLALPIVTLVVLFLWERAADRPDLGMGGLMLYNLPIIAFVITLVLSVVLVLCQQAARRRLHRDG